MRCRNAERRIRAAHGVHGKGGKGIFGLSLTLRPEGLPAVNVANKMGFPSIWKRPNLWLFQQHVEVSTRTAAFVCFLIAFAQDSLLFPAGLKGLPIHRTIVINIPIIILRIPIVGWITIPPKTSLYYDVIMFRPWHISVSHPFEIFPSASSGQLRAFRRLEGAQRMLPVWCRNERSPFPLLQVCKNRFCIIGLQSFPAQSGVETPPLPSLHCREFWRRSRNDRLVKGPGSGCTPKPIDHQNGQEWSFLVLWLYLFWGCMQKQHDQMIRTSIQKQSGSLNKLWIISQRL